MKFSANRASSPWYILNTREKRHLMAGKTRKEGVSKRKHGWTNSDQNGLQFCLFENYPAKTSVSPSSSSLGTFRDEERGETHVFAGYLKTC